MTHSTLYRTAHCAVFSNQQITPLPHHPTEATTAQSAGVEWATGCLINGGTVYFSPFQSGSTDDETDEYICRQGMPSPSPASCLHLNLAPPSTEVHDLVQRRPFSAICCSSACSTDGVTPASRPCTCGSSTCAIGQSCDGSICAGQCSRSIHLQNSLDDHLHIAAPHHTTQKVHTVAHRLTPRCIRLRCNCPPGFKLHRPMGRSHIRELQCLGRRRRLLGGQLEI